MKQRDEAIKEFYKNSKNMAETGRAFRLTRERIRQIIKGRTTVPKSKLDRVVDNKTTV